jgi:hypothetical protein
MISDSFGWAAPPLPRKTFNHPPQSFGLEQASKGAYVFVRIVAR